MSRHVERAIGSREVPLTDAQIDTKFLNQAALVIGKEAAEGFLAKCWQLDQVPDAAEIARSGVRSR